MTSHLQAVADFFAALPESAKGTLSAAERVRSVVSALAVGNLAAAVLAVLQGAGIAGPNAPEIAGAVATLIGFGWDYLRRKYLHGDDPSHFQPPINSV